MGEHIDTFPASLFNQYGMFTRVANALRRVFDFVRQTPEPKRKRDKQDEKRD
jgi:hypothetical protein